MNTQLFKAISKLISKRLKDSIIIAIYENKKYFVLLLAQISTENP